MTSLLPWRRDRTLGARDPFFAFREDMDRLFEGLWQSFEPEGFFAPEAEKAGAWTPRVALSESESEIRVDADLPGLGEKDFEVLLEGDLLTLKGEKRPEHEAPGGETRHVERAYGRFERAIMLPCEVDAERVSAKYLNGVLRVTLPKVEAESAVRRIEVRSS
ncbi:MAG TPA: hypothetical protein DEP35_09895 [Deltaproteobacteria bacterium]|nr:hypothetical protein [Deltaproteobacteria bacterium]